ncbi:MAG: HK97-gp10 family putative phage morphogenesis protein [Ktedonobacteraceae bacterium]
MSDQEFNHFDQIAEAFTPAIKQIIKKVAFDVQAAAQHNAPRDTGFLANSTYVKTSDSSTYGQGAGSPPKDSSLLPEVETPDDSTAYIAVGANYGVFPEFGTVHQAAQPYMAPSVEQVRPSFDAAISAIEAKIKEVTGL